MTFFANSSYVKLLRIFICLIVLMTGGSTHLVSAQAQGNVIEITSVKGAIESDIQQFISQNFIKTVDDYALWVETHLRYEKDNDGDQWSAPEETLTRRSGDCEDLAFLHKEVLRILGYKARVFAYGKMRQSHAICVFKKDENYYIFDNTTLNKTKATSFLDIAYYMYVKQNTKFFSELSLNPKKVNVFYFKKGNAG